MAKARRRKSPAKKTAKPWSLKKAERRLFAAGDEEAQHICEMVLGACHPPQRDFVLDDHRRITALCARGAGKTTAGLARFVIRMITTQRARCLFIAQTKDDARDLIWDKLVDWVERFGIDADFNETRLTCTFRKTGARLKLVGADDDREVNKLRGKPHHEVGIDETAIFSAKRLANIVFRAIGPRLGDFGGCLWMVSTPGHELAGLFYDATRPGSDQHRPYKDRHLPAYAGWKRWSSHAWNLEDAAPHVPAIARLWAEALVEKEANVWSDDNPIWMREYMGRWARDDTGNVFRYQATKDGKPWNQWDPEMLFKGELLELGALRIAKLEPRPDWLYALATDHGAKDPFALNVFAASPSDPTKTIYHVLCFEQPKMYAQRIAILLLGPQVVKNLDAAHDNPGGVIGAIGEWPAGMVSDSAQLGQNILDELSQVYGIKIEPAEQKGKHAAIELVNGDLVDGRLKILKGSTLEEQLSHLQWSTDEYGFVKEDKAQANHCTDTLIYARRELAVLFDAAREDAGEKKKAAHRDPFVEALGLDDPQPEPTRGEFDGLFNDPYGDIDFQMP